MAFSGLWKLATLCTVVIIAPNSVFGQDIPQEPEPFVVADAIYGGRHPSDILGEFLFADGQGRFYAPEPRNAFDGYGGLHRSAIGGLLSGNERELKRGLTELRDLYLPEKFVKAPSTHSPDILVIGLAGIEDIDTDQFKRQHAAFLTLKAGEALDRIDTADRRCVIVRKRAGGRILRTFIGALRGQQSVITGRHSAALLSCIYRGHYYHFGYSGVGRYPRKQFATFSDFDAGKGRGYSSFVAALDPANAPPDMLLEIQSRHIGMPKAEFLAELKQATGRTGKKNNTYAQQKETARSRDTAEGANRNYQRVGRGRRYGSAYDQMKKFDRWAFKHGQTKLISSERPYTRVHYDGRVGALGIITRFNHRRLKQSGWNDHLLFADRPEVADLMIVGVKDIADTETSQFKDTYKGYLEKKWASIPVYAGREWRLSRMVPDQLQNSCLAFRSEVDDKVDATLAVVVVRDGFESDASRGELLALIDCINRAHYFHLGFSNISYLPTGTFAEFIVDSEFKKESGAGYGLPKGVALTPPNLLLQAKNSGAARLRALNLYLQEVRRTMP